jgi:hypothetical protein
MGFRHNWPFFIWATIGSISFGSSFVIGNSLVPRPAAGITAFLSNTKPQVAFVVKRI